MQDKELESVTRQLLSDFFSDFTGISRPEWEQSPALVTMKRVAEDFFEDHKYLNNDLINTLPLNDRWDDFTFISRVARQIAIDEATNWAPIVGLIFFGAALCQNLKVNGRENCVELVAQEISSYFLSDQRDWLIRNNGWDGFVDFFSEEAPASTTRLIPIAVAVLLISGIVAAITATMFSS